MPLEKNVMAKIFLRCFVLIFLKCSLFLCTKIIGLRCFSFASKSIRQTHINMMHIIHKSVEMCSVYFAVMEDREGMIVEFL